MQFDEFDKKVVDAAERHHPPYDEKAWEKMEKLLDKHLPQKDNRRRRAFLWLFLALLIGGGAFIAINSNKGKRQAESNRLAEVKEDPAGNKSSATGNLSAENTSHVSAGEKPSVAATTTNGQELPKEQPGSASIIDKPVKNNLALGESKTQAGSAFQATAGAGSKTRRKKGEKTSRDKELPPARVNTTPEDIIASVINDKQANSLPNKPATNEQTPPSAVVNDKSAGSKEITNAPADNKAVDKTTEKIAEAVQPPVVTKTNKAAKKNTFFFSLSAGPDLSFASGDKMGTVKFVGGAGIGYTIKDRFTISTGFYTGRKVYTASPGSYNPPASWWSYYPNMQLVKADCKVYEIPLSLSYNFGAKKNHAWFTSAGVSSLLMKQETYDYYYKPVLTGPVYSRKWTIKDQNKHFLSVVTLSAGYQRKINNTFSLMAEPYMKLPLSGVGFGKVKLNSMGIMFTVGIAPFGKK